LLIVLPLSLSPLQIRIFFIDSTSDSALGEMIWDSTSKAWSPGTLGSAHVLVSAGPRVTLAVSYNPLWFGARPGDSGLRLLYGSANGGPMSQLCWAKSTGAWTLCWSGTGYDTTAGAAYTQTSTNRSVVSTWMQKIQPGHQLHQLWYESDGGNENNIAAGRVVDGTCFPLAC
jgi:hypothetical protein